MNVRIQKLHPDAVIPQYATAGAAGFDLVAVEDVVIGPGETEKVPLGLAFEIPEGYVLYVCMRSGIALKTKLRQPNGIGVIDSDYRGEVAMMFDNISQEFADLPLELRHVYNDWYYDITGKTQRSPGVRYEKGTYLIRKGDRVAQGVISPVARVNFVESAELSETERGDGGFGHTGVSG
ncbi:dUTP diphosphatase [Paenibacillus sp. 1P03SA]|uniref:dUTP diphosphatase n=1 Tax=Paenibacillus sp. 1P03SA TaxID=3132294 RepID=UPI0039A38910